MMGEPPRDTAVAAGLQQEEAAAAATAATAAATASPALVPTAGDQAVVDAADDDAPPPGWGQWGTCPESAPEPVLVMREDCCVMPQHSVHDAEASVSRAVLPAPDAAVADPERGLGRGDAPPAHLDEAQAEQAL
jgi:hypothetical protein